MQRSNTQYQHQRLSWRLLIVGLVLLLALAALLARFSDLDFIQRHFLHTALDDESQHLMIVPGERGDIFDRNGVPLAVSVPIDTIVFDPQVLLDHPQDWDRLVANPELHLTVEKLTQLLQQHAKSRYLIIRQHMPPSLAQKITDLHIPGVYAQTSFTTYYPMGAPDAQLVGFTNNNNQGQDGLELGYNRWLSGSPGERLVTETAINQITRLDHWIKKPHSGHDLHLSVDSRIQFIAYQALKKEVTKTRAASGSVVVLNPKNGEVLAALSYPSFNPNNIADHVGPYVRNRAMTDGFEPGSTMKVMTLSAAIDSGQYTPETPVNTSPGYWRVQGHFIRDDNNNGLTTVTGVLKHSSNVGAAKIALSLPWRDVYNRIAKAGFGSYPGGFFPGTTSGYLPMFHQLTKLDYATLSFGYDVSVSTLQLARAYAAVANQGVEYPISFRLRKHPPQGTRLMPAKTAQMMMTMMRTVVEPGGTGIRANIVHYQVVGKTGTSNKVGQHGFSNINYNAIFAGIAPMKNPALVIVVHINEPHYGWAVRFGGVSAAPVFAQIARRSLPLLGVNPSTA